jgi:hypothetical protein
MAIENIDAIYTDHSGEDRSGFPCAGALVAQTLLYWWHKHQRHRRHRIPFYQRFSDLRKALTPTSSVILAETERGVNMQENIFCG